MLDTWAENISKVWTLNKSFSQRHYYFVLYKIYKFCLQMLKYILYVFECVLVSVLITFIYIQLDYRYRYFLMYDLYCTAIFATNSKSQWNCSVQWACLTSCQYPCRYIVVSRLLIRKPLCNLHAELGGGSHQQRWLFKKTLDTGMDSLVNNRTIQFRSVNQIMCIFEKVVII